MGAAKFASRAAASFDNSYPVILKIKTEELNKELLKPDEDSKKEKWKDSLNSLGMIAYKGIIEPTNIKIENDLTIELNNGTIPCKKEIKDKTIKRLKL